MSGITEIYTYVLLDDKFRFCKTGAAFLKDFMSKHAMHADVAPAVRYSGEFHIHYDEEGTGCLVIDNNSGTFAPNKALLPVLKEVFELNFYGLPTEALSYDDPTLKHYLEELKQKPYIKHLSSLGLV
eukprot:CAMPEP_0174275926 /NCGR_PEP_ID=MMETSP0439-20130205/60104_1 /TAXON_ID=0 /ORGANISM="Stereomyxa ramosa, Strain Chinc5" /LENGTH=126 /DNA_ID=CAMNT_0015368099 /DNA_START=24 /DNA_END=404 /DNA_ORIENTATION=-